MPGLSGTRFERASRRLDAIQIVVSSAALLASGFLSSGAAFLGAAVAGSVLVGSVLAGSALAGPASQPSAASTPPSDDRFMPVAGAFVYPVGDELDFKKAASGSAYGWYVSDPYLALRGSKKQRTHFGVDLSCGRGGDPVRAIGSGVVTVADANALVKVVTKRKVKVAVTPKESAKGRTAASGGKGATGAKGAKPKKTYKTVTKTRTTWKWRTGWGNYVVIRHLLPSGETVYSLYAHLAPKSVNVKTGDIVAAGEPIGKVGKSGRANSPHLHLEVRRNAPARDGEE
ncbi:MAG TPA: M23 family metallopeptidase, partial [Candidatus Eisenbacteria bacterium]|nr:M23 family metallopeptidase [Candidatus Eisenbacteria bacterium]